MNGTGKLAAFTSISIGPPAMQAEGYDRDNPYCTGVVRLDEGPRIVARIEGVDARNPDAIEIGTTRNRDVPASRQRCRLRDATGLSAGVTDANSNAKIRQATIRGENPPRIHKANQTPVPQTMDDEASRSAPS